MSAITPDSDLFLLKCPLEMDNNHQINFNNATAQYNYFHGLPKKLQIDDDDYSYIRQDSVIRVGAHIDSLLQYNYVMYRNENYTNKWFYAFIVKMEYLNDNCTAVYIKTDVWQTWQFDITFRKCFVEREHVENDNFGLHTIPENLETGEYVCCRHSNWTYGTMADDLMVAFQVTKTDLGSGNVAPEGVKRVYGGVPQGCTVFGVPLNDDYIGEMSFIIGLYDAAGQGNAIVSMFITSASAAPWEDKKGTGAFANLHTQVPTDSWFSWGDNNPINVYSENDFQGYVPHNNKVMISPYRYFHISNNLGADVSYAYEEFDGIPQFYKQGVFSPSTSVVLSPMNSLKSSTSNNQQLCIDEAVHGGVLPQISWNSDYYLNWEAVNAKNIEIQAGLATADFGVGVFQNMMGGIMGNYADLNNDTAGYLNASSGASGITGLASNIANTMQQVRQARMTPPQAKGNTNAGDIVFSASRYRMDFYCMSIKREYAEIIDQYFDQVGYKVNAVKVPNITGRRNWNYVKCIDANILGDIPQSDMNEIKSYFNRGITIWHNPATFLDYSQDNSIV